MEEAFCDVAGCWGKAWEVLQIAARLGRAGHLPFSYGALLGAFMSAQMPKKFDELMEDCLPRLGGEGAMQMSRAIRVKDVGSGGFAVWRLAGAGGESAGG